MAVYPTGAIHKPVDNFCYDTGTMSWIMQTCSSGSSGSGGPIQDGVDPLILATVLDLVDSNPLTVAIVDAAGDQITSFGGGVQYTEGDVDPSITGTAAMMEGAGNTLLPIQGTVAGGLLVNLGTNNDVTVDNAAGAAAVNIQDGGNTITVDGTVILGAGSATVGKVDQGLTGTNAQAWWAQIGDTTNGPVAVKAASTAASAADKSLVVIESPNSKIKTASAALTSGVSTSITLSGLFSLLYLTIDTSTLFSPTGPWGGFLEVVGTASSGPYDVPVWLMPLAAGARDSIQPGLSLFPGTNNLTQAGLLSAAQNRDNRLDTFQGVSIYAIDVSGLASITVTASSTYGFTGTVTVVLQAFAVSSMQTRPTPPGTNHIGETTGAAVVYTGPGGTPGSTQSLSLTSDKRLRVDTELDTTDVVMPLILSELKAIHMQLADMSGNYVPTGGFSDSLVVD